MPWRSKKRGTPPSSQRNGHTLEAMCSPPSWIFLLERDARASFLQNLDTASGLQAGTEFSHSGTQFSWHGPPLRIPKPSSRERLSFLSVLLNLFLQSAIQLLSAPGGEAWAAVYHRGCGLHPSGGLLAWYDGSTSRIVPAVWHRIPASESLTHACLMRGVHAPHLSWKASIALRSRLSVRLPALHTAISPSPPASSRTQRRRRRWQRRRHSGRWTWHFDCSGSGSPAAVRPSQQQHSSTPPQPPTQQQRRKRQRAVTVSRCRAVAARAADGRTCTRVRFSI